MGIGLSFNLPLEGVPLESRRAVRVFWLGCVAMENPLHPSPVNGNERNAQVERLEAFFAALSTAHFPETVKLACMTSEEQFDRGVAATSDGLRSRICPLKSVVLSSQAIAVDAARVNG